MTGTLFSQMLGVFGTGILASLSPCVYPMIPITVGFLGSQANKGSKSNVIMYVIGQALALVVIGLIAVRLGETLGFSSENPAVNLVVGVFLILAGLFSLMGRLPRFFDQWNQGSNIFIQKYARGPLAAFLLGVGAALIASPCTSPILGGVLAMMATSGTMAKGILLMVMYAAGFSVVFLVLGLGVLQMNQLPKAGAWMVRAHKTASVILLLAGAYYIGSTLFVEY